LCIGNNKYIYFYRLWKKNEDKKKIAYLNQQRLDEISNMFNGVNFVNVDHLEDTEVNNKIYLLIPIKHVTSKKKMFMRVI